MVCSCYYQIFLKSQSPKDNKENKKQIKNILLTFKMSYFYSYSLSPRVYSDKKKDGVNFDAVKTSDLAV